MAKLSDEGWRQQDPLDQGFGWLWVVVGGLIGLAIAVVLIWIRHLVSLH